MTKIRKIIEIIESIPEKEKRKSEIGTLALAQEKIGGATAAARDMLTSCATLESIEGAAFVDKVRAALLQCGAPSRQLHSKIAKKDAISNAQIDEYLTRIGDRIQEASDAIARGWASQVQSWMRRYQPLVDAARQIQLPGVSGMEAAMAAVAKWENKVKLGFEGKVGEFMVRAAQGVAPARDLQDAEVLAFLNKYPTVWKLLQVKL
jgi:hypothetical protein